mgnify:CR=1 FL=1
MRKSLQTQFLHLGIALLVSSFPFFHTFAQPAEHVPAEAPRVWVPSGQKEAFVAFSRSGGGKAYYERLRADFDKHWLDWALPAEPSSYGDPDPEKRTSEMVDKWRAMQDLGGRIGTVAETATLLWLVSGEDKYLEKAKAFLLGVSRWDPRGATGIDSNDEAHFRIFRKFPGVYDHIRDELTAEEKEIVLDHFRVRGRRNMVSILEDEVDELRRNSVEQEPASHAVRFLPMTGVAALAFWDDLPEARAWWDFVHTWYRDVFTPWGGEDGGWAEGVAYWRGVYEHAVFQDALLVIGDPRAYRQPFWEETGYFQVYFVQPYLATGFGDLSNAAQFNMEPGVKHFLDHLGRVTGNGYFPSWADLYADPRPLPREMGMRELSRLYPTASEYWVREYIASREPVPEKKPLTQLPGSRHFRGIGWVSMHSALGRPEEDIMLSFKSSPYGSFSHSHADQNAFILNAYGEQLAINAGYREYHRSQMHKYYTRQTISKNALLINRQGQEVQDKDATGRIVRFQRGDRHVWTTGDATVAYNTRQPESDTIGKAWRDIVFIDNRYFVIRDHVVQKDPGRIDWLLHAREPITFHEIDGSFTISRHGAHLLGRLRVPDNELRMRLTTEFPVEVDPKYKDISFVNANFWLSKPARDQAHFQAGTVREKEAHIVFAVLWPTRMAGDAKELRVDLEGRDTLRIRRPDGIVDKVLLTDDRLRIETVAE